MQDRRKSWGWGHGSVGAAMSCGGLFVSSAMVGGAILMMRWNDEVWWAEMELKALAVGGVGLVLGALVATHRWMLRRSEPETLTAPPAAPDPGWTLDTIVVAVAVRGAAGRALLGEHGATTPTEPRSLVDDLIEHRHAWVGAAWLDDDPVAAGDAAGRIAIPLDRLAAALPTPERWSDGGYRDGEMDDRVVVIAFGGTTRAELRNAGSAITSQGLESLLQAIGRVQRWEHLQVVGGGPLESDALDDLPLRFRRF